jgi:diguanylate cyclase (GGDEF)-like protein
MTIVLAIIALQQGLFALGWWVAGWGLNLSRRAAGHWVVASLAAALSVALILQRGHWPDLLTIVVANVLAMSGFVAMRRGVQVFLRLPPTDLESGVLLAAVAVVLALYLQDAQQARLAVLGTSSLIAWTLLRCAHESRRALRAVNDGAGARVVALPLALLGAVYALRVALGALRPDLAARPLHEDNAFNGAVIVSFMVVGLLINLVLAYLVANRLVRRLHQLSIRDPLTGLLNRRGLAPRLVREATRWRRKQVAYAVLVIDVDHFKAVNDRHGHAAGDSVLVRLAEVLGQVARDVDTVARLGGEEFCLLLPDTEIVRAHQVGERICKLVRGTAWPVPAADGGGLTVSIGVAVVAGDDGPHRVLARADAALLLAKQGGRDRAVIGP